MTYSNIRKYVENGVTINDFHARGGVITRKQFISTIVDTREQRDGSLRWSEKLRIQRYNG